MSRRSMSTSMLRVPPDLLLLAKERQLQIYKERRKNVPLWSCLFEDPVAEQRKRQRGFGGFSL